MHVRQLETHRHEHTFGTDQETRGEKRTRWVVGLTVVMMVLEVIGGTIFGSMALLADGWHMGTHAAALGITVFAYAYARRHATDPRYSFGTGKVGALGGFASAIALAIVAALVFGESALRLAEPVAIRFDEAIGVAVLGLVVNLVSAALLWERHDHHHGHDADELHTHHHHDHNLRGAFLHVLADALTSVLAIGALLAGKLVGWTWLDPAIGMAGSLVIARWAYGLLVQTSATLLDAEASPERRRAILEAIESDADNRVADLHLWRVGPRHVAAIISVVSHHPREPAHYKRLLARFDDLAHVTVEVHRCEDEACADPS